MPEQHFATRAALGDRLALNGPRILRGDAGSYPYCCCIIENRAAPFMNFERGTTRRRVKVVFSNVLAHNFSIVSVKLYLIV